MREQMVSQLGMVQVKASSRSAGDDSQQLVFHEWGAWRRAAQHLLARAQQVARAMLRAAGPAPPGLQPGQGRSAIATKRRWVSLTADARATRR